MAWIIVGFIIILIIDFFPLMGNKKKNGMIAFLVFFAAALTLAILQNRGVSVPSTVNLIGDFFKSIGIAYKS